MLEYHEIMYTSVFEKVKSMRVQMCIKRNI